MADTIRLSEEEVYRGAAEGVARVIRNALRGRLAAYGAKRSWDLDVEAALAELAAAKHLELPWEPLADIDTTTGDLANGRVKLQVRSTPRVDGSLILHRSDHDEHAFVLVCGSFNSWKVAGWMFAREGKRPDCWRPAGGNIRHAAYFVPQGRLRPMEELRRLIDDKDREASDGE